MTTERFALARRSGSPAAAAVIHSRFSRREILLAIERWEARYGAPPMQVDWDPARALREGNADRVARFECGDWPTAKMVRRQFGTFSTALSEAGCILAPHLRTKPQLLDPADILRAIRDWTARYGEPPANADWDPSRARRLGQEWRVARYESDDWPSLGTVRNHYGSMGAAITAAGLRPCHGSSSPTARRRRGRDNLVSVAREEAAAQTKPGPRHLAPALEQIAVARRRDDVQALRHGLVTLASVALAWAHASGWAPEHVSTDAPDSDNLDSAMPRSPASLSSETVSHA